MLGVLAPHRGPQPGDGDEGRALRLVAGGDGAMMTSSESSELPSSAWGGASGCSPRGGGSAETNRTEGGWSHRPPGPSPPPQQASPRSQPQVAGDRPSGPASGQPWAPHPFLVTRAPPAPQFSSERFGRFEKAQHLQKVRLCLNWGDSGLRQGVSKASSQGAGTLPPASCKDVGGAPTGGHCEPHAVCPPAHFCPHPPTQDQAGREGPPDAPSPTEGPPSHGC